MLSGSGPLQQVETVLSHKQEFKLGYILMICCLEMGHSTRYKLVHHASRFDLGYVLMICCLGVGHCNR